MPFWFSLAPARGGCYRTDDSGGERRRVAEAGCVQKAEGAAARQVPHRGEEACGTARRGAASGGVPARAGVLPLAAGRRGAGSGADPRRP